MNLNLEKMFILMESSLYLLDIMRIVVNVDSAFNHLILLLYLYKLGYLKYTILFLIYLPSQLGHLRQPAVPETATYCLHLYTMSLFRHRYFAPVFPFLTIKFNKYTCFIAAPVNPLSHSSIHF